MVQNPAALTGLEKDTEVTSSVWLIYLGKQVTVVERSEK